MTFSNVLSQHEDCITTFERALAETNGIRVGFTTYEAAWRFRSKLHHARMLDRKKINEVAQPGDPVYNTSAFDCLICTLKKDKDKYWVYIRPNIAPGEVEVLDE